MFPLELTYNDIAPWIQAYGTLRQNTDYNLKLIKRYLAKEDDLMSRGEFFLLLEGEERVSALKDTMEHVGIVVKSKPDGTIYSNGVSNRATQEHFQRSGNTVSRCFHQVLLLLHRQVIKLPGATQPLDPRIADDKKCFPYFQDCNGALDGTHVDAFIQSGAQPPYRNRKGDLMP